MTNAQNRSNRQILSYVRTISDDFVFFVIHLGEALSFLLSLGRLRAHTTQIIEGYCVHPQKSISNTSMRQTWQFFDENMMVQHPPVVGRGQLLQWKI